MNYGHTFGHALESVTITDSHGVAVSWGIGLANFVSYHEGLLSKEDMECMETLVLANSKDIETMTWPLLGCPAKGQKHRQQHQFQPYEGFGRMFKHRLPLNQRTKGYILEYLGRHGRIKKDAGMSKRAKRPFVGLRVPFLGTRNCRLTRRMKSSLRGHFG